MKISAGYVQSNLASSSNTKTLYTQKLSKDEEKVLRTQIVDNANAFTFKASSIQSTVATQEYDFMKAYKEFQSFLTDIGYKGGSIANLTKEEAAPLVAKDGIFGVKQTAQRIANFVINGAQDASMLRAGKEGMLQGFKDAQAMWGGKLPEISQKTMQEATQMVDKAMSDLGYSIVDTKV